MTTYESNAQRENTAHVAAVEHVREEAVQVAAVALAMVEAIDRGAWKR